VPAGVTETDKAIQSTEQWNRRILANAVVCSRVRELHSAAGQIGHVRASLVEDRAGRRATDPSAFGAPRRGNCGC